MRLILLVLVVEESRVVVLLHELLRWLVHIHVGHLLLGLSGLLLYSFCGLFLFFILLYSLNALELIENVLVVEQCVGELVHEGRACEEPIDTALKYRHLQQLMNCGPLSWVSLQHHRDYVVDSWGIVGG